MAQPQYPTQPVDTDGIPPGIPYIIGNEAAERFCFYGMRTILIFARRVKSKFLSMTPQLGRFLWMERTMISPITKPES